MKKVLITILSCCLVVILNQQGVSAQDKEEPHVYVLTTFTMAFPEDGTMAEIDSLEKIYIEKLVKPNTKIISQKHMAHYYGSDQRDYVVITEYANWCDIAEANKQMQELVEEVWPEKGDRQAFFDAYFKYFKTHSDEIYRGLPHLDK